jgi:hypothetical protein
VYVVKNEALARRQVRRGNLFLFAALGVFATGFAVASFRGEDELSSIFTLGALLLGVFCWQVSLYYTRRWGPKERQDVPLVSALKGLDNRYTLVVFSAARLPDYLLVGPLGVRVLVPRAIDGTVRGRGDQWTRLGSPAWRSLLLGNPARNPTEEARQSVDRVEDYLRRNLEPAPAEPVPVGATLVFTNPRVRLEAENTTFPAVTPRELRGHVQRLKGSLSPPQVTALRRLFEPPSAGTAK